MVVCFAIKEKANSAMGNTESFPEDGRERSFPGAALLDNLQCGSVDDVDDNNPKPKQQNGFSKFFNHAETLCAQSPTSDADYGDHSFDDEYETFRKDKDDDDTLEDDDDTKNSIKDPAGTPASAGNPTSALFARALVSEVTDNPKTMKPAAMAEREKKLLKAQEKARDAHKNGEKSRPVGAPGGVGQPSVLGSIAHALTGSTDPLGTANYDYNKDPKASVLPPNSMSENRAQVDSSTPEMVPGKHTVTIGLSLTRRSSVGHQDTVTRQTAFDFNELQDRQYKYVSSTDSCGWRAGGGERGGPQQAPVSDLLFDDEGNEQTFGGTGFGTSLKKADPGTPSGGQIHKVAAPDTVHIPIIHIDAESPQAVDDIIAALARGEVFIPHMAIIPEALSVDGVSPPDLVVRFGTERNDDMPPDEWPNWCLEFMHNQLYEYFHGMGARWMKRPFSITLAKKVRWKTVKHMNRYFAHSERVIDAWREKGPQYLDPQLAYIEGGATPEEVARPHGIYLLRNGVPTNYFAPNFDPPYTTKMTRSLLLNVLGKSWDKKRREWTSEPIPRLVTPVMLVSAMCGCSDNAAGGFMAREATLVSGTDTSNIPHNALIRSDPPPPTEQQQQQRQKKKQELPPNTPSQRPPPSEYTQADTDIISDVVQGSRDPPSKTEPEPLSKQPPQQQQQQQQQLKTRPEQLSLDDLSLEEQRNPIDPVASSETEFNENKQLQLLHVVMNNSPGSAYSKECARSVSKHTAKTLDEELQELDDTLNLHVKSQAVPVKSPKYGQAPTPERLSSPRSALGEKAEDKSSSVATRDPDAVNQSLATPMDVGATSDYVQPSVTGTNSTIMHMNLSTEAFVKREFERTLGRSDEKKEEDVRPVGPTLASDEDWLDELVSRIRSSGSAGKCIIAIVI